MFGYLTNGVNTVGSLRLTGLHQFQNTQAHTEQIKIVYCMWVLKDVSVLKDAIWLENLNIILPEYQDMFHYELIHYFVSRTLPIK
jgi:hypothetical protein